MDTSIEYNDIQGLARFDHGHLKGACFLLLKIERPEAARAWLGQASITTAEKLVPPPTTALQIAFTCQGLRAMGVPAEIIQGFSSEFISGMAGEESRSRRLGDTAANAPAQWLWGRPDCVPDVLLMLYAEKGRLEDLQRRLVGQLTDAGFQLLQRSDTGDLGGYEPFGFRDGVSQPQIDWRRERKPGGGEQSEYSNLIALGEFLLGYPNEYGKYTDRPLVDPLHDPRGALPQAEDQPGKKDLGRNGSYLVVRQLQQDVRGFWQFLDRQANSDPEERQKLAAAMVGRTRACC
jgi:hypothetical protein